MTAPFEVEQDCENSLCILDASGDIICQIVADDVLLLEHRDNAEIIAAALNWYFQACGWH